MLDLHLSFITTPLRTATPGHPLGEGKGGAGNQDIVRRSSRTWVRKWKWKLQAKCFIWCWNWRKGKGITTRTYHAVVIRIESPTSYAVDAATVLENTYFCRYCYVLPKAGNPKRKKLNVVDFLIYFIFSRMIFETCLPKRPPHDLFLVQASVEVGSIVLWSRNIFWNI